MERISGKRFSPGGSAVTKHQVVSRNRSPGRSEGGASLSTSMVSSRGVSAVHTMLNDLIEISHGIASYLDQENAEVQQQSRQQTALKAQEIERIVKKVEAHYSKRIASLESRNAQLENEVLILAKKIKSMQQQQQFTQTSSFDTPTDQLFLPAQTKPTELPGLATHSGATVEDLRNLLSAEKRQRLMVEEQTQSLAEQHAKVVATLERRLLKQEEQLRELMSALERPMAASGGATAGDGSSDVVPVAMRTPRRLVRQQLAQSQQTTEELQQYRQQLNDSASAPVVREARLSPRPAQAQPPPTDTKIDGDARLEPARLSGGKHNSTSTTSTNVDEIGHFLDTISKELASMGGSGA